MNFKEKTGQSIGEAFAIFHNKNPRVYTYFKIYFESLHKRKGWQKVSAKLIMERVRWEVFTSTSDPNFVINNNYTAHYARLFVTEHPQFKKCFEFRRVAELEQPGLF